MLQVACSINLFGGAMLGTAIYLGILLSRTNVSGPLSNTFLSAPTSCRI